MRYKELRRREEQALLFKVCLEGAKTEEEVLKGKLDFDFLSSCLEIREMRTLMGIGQRKSKGLFAYYDTLENLVTEAIAREAEYGVRPIVVIELDDITTCLYEFQIVHVIVKGKRKIKHTNTLTFHVKDEESAMIMFKRKIKQLGHELFEVKRIDKSFHGVITKDDRFYQQGTFDISPNSSQTKTPSS